MTNQAEIAVAADDPIVVCLKWVPTRPEIDPLTGEVSTDERFSGLSPADRAALEWALRVGEAQGRPVQALSFGAQGADIGLREALAHGAATATRVHHPAPDRVDSRAVAVGLAEGCRAAASVFCGDHSLDRGSGSVPAFLANELNYGQALGCVRMQTTSDGAPADPAIVERRLDQGRRERLALQGRTVVSFEGGLELRRAPLSGAIDAGRATITVIDAPAFEPATAISPGPAGPYRPRSMVLAAPVGSTKDRIEQLSGVGEERSGSQQLELEPEAAAAAVVEQLRGWGYLD